MRDPSISDAAWTAGIGFAVSLAATGAVLQVALRKKILDLPNERSSHSTPKPRAGGIGIFAGLLVALLAMGSGEWMALVPLGACAWIGLHDDVLSLRASVKGLLLLAAAFVGAIAWNGAVRVASGTPFAGDVGLGPLAVPLTVLFLTGYANAFNFMDGIDGIATLTAIVSAAVFTVAGLVHADPLLASLGGAIVGAALGFLPWNFPAARIFMGDAGSLPLGMALATCAVMANASGSLAFPASVLLLGPFLFDVAFTLVRRATGGRKIGAPHKEHLYQRLSRVWGSHAKVSLLYAGFSVVTGCLALCYGGLTELGKLLSLTLPVAAMLGFAAFVLRAERVKGS